MSHTPDQGAIDALYRKLKGEEPASSHASGDGGPVDPRATLRPDIEIVKAALAGRDSADFGSLHYEGFDEESGKYPSRSEAEMRYVGILAKHTPDGDQIDRIYRLSKLARPKWDEARGGTTYGQQTIDKALSERSQGERTTTGAGHRPDDGGGVTASRPPIVGVTPVTPLRFSEMDEPGPREYVVEDLVPKGHVTTFFGDGGSAKSIVALSAATAIAGGAGKWLGRKVQSCPVLYADFELDGDEQRRRAYQVARGVHLDKPPHDLLYVCGLGRPAGEVLKACLAVCAEHEVGFVIVDSLGIALGGDAEAARDVIRFHHEYLDPFRAEGITLFTIDHQGKLQPGERYQSKRAFGSVYKENLSRSVVQVKPGYQGEGFLNLELRQTKHNFGPKAAPFGVRLAFSEKKITVDERKLTEAELAEERRSNSSDRVLLVLKDGPSYPQGISDATGMPLGTVKNALTDLRSRGLVEYTGKTDPKTKAKEVRLTADGRSVIDVMGMVVDDVGTPTEEDGYEELF